jgi:DNA (cytosine-5)-methyltransferase 1
MIGTLTLGTDCTGVDAAFYAVRECLDMMEMNTTLEYKFASEIDSKIRHLITQTTCPDVLYEDLTQRNVAEMPTVDIYIVGFPCQTFSIVGKRQGTQDARGQIFDHIYEYIDMKRPTCFVLENVPGLMSIDNGRFFDHMMQVLHNLDCYDIHYDVLSPTDINFPQNRKRLFVQGTKHEITTQQNSSNPRVMPPIRSLQDFILSREDAMKYQPRIGRELTNRQSSILQKVLKMINCVDGNYIWDTRRSAKYIYKPKKNTCPCIVQHCYSLYLLNQKRYLSCLELLLLQGLSDQTLLNYLGVYDCKGNVSFISKIVGNSICVPLLKYILQPMLNSIC